jgi:hypothetical protein
MDRKWSRDACSFGFDFEPLLIVVVSTALVIGVVQKEAE